MGKPKEKKTKTSSRAAHFEKQSKAQEAKKAKRFKTVIPHRPEARAPKKENTFLPPSNTIVGVLKRSAAGWSVQSTDFKNNLSYLVSETQIPKLQAGKLVVAELVVSRKSKTPRTILTRELGDPEDPRMISLTTIYKNEIPDAFSDAALGEAARGTVPPLAGRTDLRALPLVTIDGEDARDFDDAVFAEKDGSGWHIVVAIADVAHYVRPGSALDREAFERGNSTYFPNRVVPMLPEKLSNDLCSLRPETDRACMAAHLWIDRKGELTRYRFERGLMKSHARLTYEQVQAARDGKPDATTRPLVESVIKPLYGAFACLHAARVERGTLDLDLPERKILLGKDGHPKAVVLKKTLDSHRLIEEFMIAANVAAASQLEDKKASCVYRIHDKPSELRLLSFKDFLASLGYEFTVPEEVRPSLFKDILEKASKDGNGQVVNEVVLRLQSKAVYHPENIGHFGLCLARYAHFTSPIRRYADLVVHRALIRALQLGAGGLDENQAAQLEEVAGRISATERRSQEAEREANNRYTAHYIARHADQTLEGKISGLSSGGLFVKLEGTGADGYMPFKSMPRDEYLLNKDGYSALGLKSGRIYRLGQNVVVRLVKADKLTGNITFSLDLCDQKAKDIRQAKTRMQERSKRGKADLTLR